MKCPKCGVENPDNSLECSHCGIVFEKYKRQQQQEKNQSSNASPQGNQEKQPGKRCPFCKGVVHKEAIKCKYCGEFFDGNQYKSAHEVHHEEVTVNYLLSGLLDLSFQKLISPTLVKVTYAVLLVVGGLAEVILLLYNLFNKNFLAAISSLLVFLIILLSLRMYSEFLIIAFKIERNTQNLQR